FVHSDTHQIVFDPGFDGTTNQTIWVGTDGGVYNTTTGAKSLFSVTSVPLIVCGINAPFLPVEFTKLDSTYVTGQFYHGAVSSDGAVYVGGLQDQGVLK